MKESNDLKDFKPLTIACVYFSSLILIVFLIRQEKKELKLEHDYLQKNN